MDVNNTLQVDSANSNHNLKIESFLKINASKLEQSNKSGSNKSDDVEKPVDFALGSKLVLSKNYLDQLINIVDNIELKKQIATLQKIGLLDFKNDIATLIIDYKNSEFFINNKSLQLWSEKYNNAQLSEQKPPKNKRVEKKSASVPSQN